MSSLSGLKWIILAISGVFLLVGFVVSYFIGKNISKPVVELTNQCLTMSEGDFTADLNEKYAGRHDEIGELTRGFKKINDNVAGIIKNVIREAERVDQANSVTGENMTKLTDQIGVMASITQDLSAKMEETSAMAEKMNATTTEIEAAIESIAVKAQKGAESAGEVSSRADELRRNAEESQKSAQDILRTMRKTQGGNREIKGRGTDKRALGRNPGDSLPNKSSGAERGDRSRAGRRLGQRLCCCG